MPARASWASSAALGPVGDHEIRAQRQDPLDIGVEQSSYARQRLHLRGEIVEAADGDDLRTGLYFKEHLGQRRDKRNDALAAARSRPEERRLLFGWREGTEPANEERIPSSPRRISLF